VDCGAAGTYEIVTARGNGEWTPGMDVCSTTEGFDEEFGQEVRVEFSGEVSVVIRP
jgi:hypothetical protein